MPQRDLFDRVCIVNVDGSELINFDVDGEVVLTTETTPNKAKIKIYNLDKDLQAAVRKKDARVALTLGYQNADFAEVFLGDIRYAPSGLVGSDWVTVLEAGDAERAIQQSQAGITWAKGKDVSKVVEELLQTFEDVDMGDFQQTFKSKMMEQFPNGGAFSGNSMRVLDEILRGYGWSVSVQKRKFQFIQLSTGKNTEIVQSLDPSTGLIDEPDVGEPDKKTGKAKAKITSLLMPKIIPGCQVHVTGTTDGLRDGDYTVQKVTHQFSNWQPKPFYTVMEATTT